ncbi:MAG: DUF3786 domain-containing protein [Eubacterium sp.]
MVQEIDPHYTEKSYLVNKEKFKNFDPIKMSEFTGIAYNVKDGTFVVDVLGEKYRGFWPSGDIVRIDGEAVSSYSVKIIMMRYMMCAQGKPPTKELIGYKEFPDGNLYYANFYSRCIQVFAELFNDKGDELAEYMKNIGGKKMNKGDAAYTFSFMKNVELGCILWYGDEEFAPEGQILFDKNLTNVLSIKDFAVLGDVFIQSLKSFKPTK